MASKQDGGGLLLFCSMEAVKPMEGLSKCGHACATALVQDISKYPAQTLMDVRYLSAHTMMMETSDDETAKYQEMPNKDKVSLRAHWALKQGEDILESRSIANNRPNSWCVCLSSSLLCFGLWEDPRFYSLFDGYQAMR